MRPDMMIVDDSVEQLELMKYVLRNVDPKLQVTTASSGDIALKELRQHLGNLPKVILLDLRMPGKSGQEVLSELKSDPLLKRIPVCIFSNADLDGEICDCYERGASFYFKKPTGLIELKKFVEYFKGTCISYASHCPN